MTRPLLLATLALAFAACADPGAGLTVEETHDAAQEAAETGDARGALALYKSAARRGDLGSMKEVASIYDRGYVRDPTASYARHLPVHTVPGQASRWRERYERERDQLALAGDPAGWMRVASDLRYPSRERSQANLDSADAILHRLAGEDHAPALLTLAMNAKRDGDDARALALLEDAESLGSAQACYVQVFWKHGLQIVTAQQTAAFIDSTERCYALDPDLANASGSQHSSEAERILGNLSLARARGEQVAIRMLDSLRQFGVFERHPRLAAFAGELSENDRQSSGS